MKASINAAGVQIEVEYPDTTSVSLETFTDLVRKQWYATLTLVPKPAEAPRQQLGYAAQTEATTPRRARFEWSMGDGRQPGVDA